MSKTFTLLTGLILLGPWASPADALRGEAEIVKEDLDREPDAKPAPAQDGVVILSTASFSAASAGAWLPAVRQIAYSRSEDR